MVIVPHVVLWLQLLCYVGVTITVIAPCGCCHHHLCAVYGFVVLVIVLYGFCSYSCCITWVLLLLSLHCVWCCSHSCCATWVLPSPSSCRMWCHRCHHCAICGFMVVVAGPRRRGQLCRMHHVCACAPMFAHTHLCLSVSSAYIVDYLLAPDLHT